MTASGALEAVERIVNRGGDPDAVLRAALAAVLERLPHLEALRLRRDRDEVVVGATRHDAWVDFRAGAHHAAVAVPAALVREGDRPVLRRVAVLVSPYC